MFYTRILCFVILINSFQINGQTISITDGKVELRNRNLKDFGPFWFFPSHIITSVDVSFNRISEVRYESLWDLSRLKNANFSYNKIGTIELNSFEHAPRLERLDLKGNSIKLSNFLQKGSRQLEFLDLSGNQITDIYENSFKLPKLKVLNLSDNKIVRINKNGFNGLIKLRELNLSKNNLTELNKLTLSQSMTSLRRLDLSKNNFTITNIIAPYLTDLNMENNEISEIVTNAFRGSPILENLNLSGNKILTFQKNALEDLFELKFVNLSNNLIDKLSWTVFHKDDLLESLDLSFNRISVIAQSKFPFLKYLNMGSNVIAKIPIDGFKGSPQLETINLSNNQINQIEKNSFKSTTNLKFLDLSNNKLTTLFSDNLKTLKYLNLAYNSFTQFPKLNPALEELDMKSNKLSTNSSLMIGENNLKKINLSNNELITIARTFLGNSLKLETLDLSFSAIRSIEKNSFTNSSNILNLNLEYNYIQDSQFLEPLSSIEILNLKENGIQSIKLSNPELKYINLENNEIKNMEFEANLLNLESLILRNAKLSSFNFSVLERVPNIKYLYLERSEITKVGEVFNKLRKIEEIYLSGNQQLRFDVSSELKFNNLKSIDLSFCSLTRLDVNLFETSFPELHKLSIVGNPWKCACLDILTELLRKKEISFQHFDGNTPACLTSNNVDESSVCNEETEINLGNLQNFYKTFDFLEKSV